jgi:hypothetical protein
MNEINREIYLVGSGPCLKNFDFSNGKRKKEMLKTITRGM